MSGTLPDPDANTLRCYPDYWTESGVTDPVESWFSKYVVASVTVEDTTGDAPDEVTQYTYSDPAWHYDDNPLTQSDQRTWDQWRGFKKVTTETGTAADPDTETTDTYFQGMNGDYLADGDTSSATLTSGQGQTVTDDDQYAGIDFEHVVYDGPGGDMVTDKVTEPWTSSDTADEAMPSPLPALESYLTGTTETLTYTALTSGDRESTVTYTHDSDGRVTETSDVPDTSDSSQDTCTTTSYATDTTDWVLDLPSQTEVTAVPCGTTATAAEVVSDNETFYDGATSLSADDPVAGDVTETLAVTSYTGDDVSDPVWTEQSHATYDEYGRVLDSYDADDRETITAYNPTAGSQPSQITVEDPLGLTTTTTYNPLLGTELTQQTPQGWTTTRTYDALGRVTAVWTPGHSTSGDAQYTYSYSTTGDAPWVATTNTLEPDGTSYLTSEVLYDSLDRERETQDENAAGNTVVTDTDYDADGRKLLVSNAYYITGAPTTSLVAAADDEVPSQTGYDYDGAGRVTTVQSFELAAETSRTDYAYGGDYYTTTYVNDRSGQVTGGTPETVFTDGRGLTSKIYQYHSESDAAEGPSVSSADYDVTSYTYTGAGKLATITDDAGSKWEYGYDLAGDKTSETDPDTGTGTMTYDAAGQLLTSTDARGKEITYSYDDDGDKTEEYDTTGGSEIASWTYSDGELSSESSYYDGDAYTVKEIGYDAYGLSEGTETTIPDGDLAGTYIQELDYNAYDDEEDEYIDSKADGLDGEAVHWSLDNAGEQTQLWSTLDDSEQVYVDALSWTNLGQPSEYTWNSSDAWTTDSYDEETGALTGQDTYTGTGVAEVDALSYDYDNTGQLTEVSDEPSGDSSADDTQCFGYDYLGRVTQAWSQSSATCGTPSVTSEAEAAAPYWEAYTYNDENDLTAQTSTAADGTVTTTADSYPSADGDTDAHPHAVSSSAVTTGATTDTTSYAYDDDGDLTSETGATTGTLAWDDAGRLTSDTTSSGTTSYIYDADGNLLVTEDPGSDTLYLGDEEISYDSTSKDTTAVRYYSIAGSVAASRTVTGTYSDDAYTYTTGTSYLTGDVSGTASLAIDATSLDLTRRWYDPYGAEVASSGTWDGNKGFQDGPADDTTSLDDLGAREYNPATGSFISADPLLDAYSPQDLNPYAYAQDTAPSGEDPSGLYEAGPPGSGCSTGSEWEKQCGGSGINPNGGSGSGASTPQGKKQPGNGDSLGGGKGSADVVLPVAARATYVRWLATFQDINPYAKGAAWQLDSLAVFCNDYPGDCPRGLYNSVVWDRDTIAAATSAAIGAAGLFGGGEDGGFAGPGDGGDLADMEQAAAWEDLDKIAAEEGGDLAPEIKAGSSGGPTAGKVFLQSIRQQALEENPSTCVYCRMETDTPQVDHAIPRSVGGNATIENAQTTCAWCNASKGARAFPVNPPPEYEGPWPPEWWGIGP